MGKSGNLKILNLILSLVSLLFILKVMSDKNHGGQNGLYCGHTLIFKEFGFATHFSEKIIVKSILEDVLVL